MSEFLPVSPMEFLNWSWQQIEPYFLDLQRSELNAQNLRQWLADWSRLGGLVYETYQRLYVAITVDTTDAAAHQRYETFLDEIYPKTEAANNQLKEKLLSSGLETEGFELPLRNMKAEAEIFSEDNLPLLAQEMKLKTESDRINGAQTIQWEGSELTLTQLLPIYQHPDRQRRERAWRLSAARQLADREEINQVWVKMLELRGKITRGAALPDYRAYRWKQMLRFDYNPEDCSQFHQAIEQVAVPAAISLYERRRKRLGLAQLRPWDVYVDPESRPQIKPFQSAQELEEGVSSIFRQVDPELQAYFEIMRREGLLDLDNRKGKAPGGYCTDFVVSGKPFIFMNAVGIREDVQTLLHEGGHAFHVFESAALPFLQQKQVGLEFAEVASMGMELLAAPYLSKEQGGFYSKQETARARIEHLEEAIRFWAYMAVVDAFQHWVYENLELAKDPLNCDAKWGELWDRFMLGVDWSGLEDEKNTGWQRKLHIFQDPFYYIEYGLAQMGAFQVWRNALQDQKGAVVNYRKALALGGTASLPQLFQTAGVRFAFDAETLREVVELGMKTIEALENEI